MEVYFFDSSAIVKRYVIETGSTWVQGVVDPASGNRVYVARITVVEVVAALTRQGRGGALTPTGATAAVSQFRLGFSNEYRLVEVTPAVLVQAMDLAESHALRGYDAVQLVSALRANTRRLTSGLPALTLVSADAALNAAALAEGLPVDDPNAHP